MANTREQTFDICQLCLEALSTTVVLTFDRQALTSSTHDEGTISPSDTRDTRADGSTHSQVVGVERRLRELIDSYIIRGH